ncbi:2-C-methyl-D-erythritol 4-phosphate cytidylyltransferase [Mycolicibacterium flavescens]|uniref:2-C-methyl-D-erythritol 4-phosphate cytidylyltransferase n=1 Tax=Mycolicibacterium flavescens TaxID=1776 RepID=A0A1E3RJ39_MYCFV|nr:2-C-methyl-D-erythritol 4-phosphate cytidylyltransferase [Mycolicibacterium flavescens]MCV7281153.1 2-C-methyl-D-erythritol 4-phosphate cytidylyltransferase [Mycolicibacterium flavescens]ODQ89895.1 hypothetical protein BHQ18_13440 [Mycolicibacterium flavescens]
MTAQLSAVVPVPPVAADIARYRLDGSAVLEKVVRALLESVADPAAVVVACAPAHVDIVETLLADDDLEAVQVLAGGTDWMQCLAAVVTHIARQANSARYVLVHDVRQPLTSAAVRDSVVTALGEGAEMVLPVLPVTDSVKAVDAQGAVTATLDRSTLRTAQFPRGFATARLVRIVDTGTADEIAAALATGAPITTVEGDPHAFVVESRSDTVFVDAVMSSRR